MSPIIIIAMRMRKKAVPKNAHIMKTISKVEGAVIPTISPTQSMIPMTISPNVAQ
jgi:hypothetical protein